MHKKMQSHDDPALCASANGNSDHNYSGETKLQKSFLRSKIGFRSGERQLSVLIILSFIFVLSTFYSAEKMLIVRNQESETNTHLARRKPKEGEAETNVVHIINTRFMQNQGNLFYLGLARLYLFQVFCLPTVLNQSSQHFLWIIRIDPKLNNNIQSRFLQILDDATKKNERENVIVIQSNENPEGFRSSECLPDQRDVLYGNWPVLKRIHDQSQHSVLLETVLDADDGLHMKFVSYVQNLAKAYLSGNKNDDERWLIWCAKKSFEWHADVEAKASDHRKGYKEAGAVFFAQVDYCVTPGLTYGLSPDTQYQSIPQHTHHLLHQNVIICPDGVEQGDKSKDDINISNCLLSLDTLTPVPAVRARTTTSTGMKNVGITSTLIKEQKKLWMLMIRSFNIQRKKSFEVVNFIKQHLAEIAKDNLEGQCNLGHSCKDSSKKILKQVIDKKAGRKHQSPKK